MDLTAILPLLISQQLQAAPDQPAAPGASSLSFLGLMNGMLGGEQDAAGAGLFGGDAFGSLGMFSLLEQLLALQIQQGQSAGNSVLSTQGWNQPGGFAPSGNPLGTGRLTQEYHAGHHALDFGVPVGTPVHTTMDGDVVYAGWNNEGYGNLVIVDNGTYRTYYAHLSEIPVQVGQRVQAGAVIGLSGNTGNSTGPHLHYEIRRNGAFVDPATTMAV